MLMDGSKALGKGVAHIPHKSHVEVITEYLNGWKFEVSKTQILKSTELDQLTDRLKLQRVPDIVYGNNSFEIHHVKSGLTFWISAIDSLSYANIARRKEAFLPNYGQTKTTEVLDCIQAEPTEVKVKEAKYWQNKAAPLDGGLKVLEKLSDWTYSTPYKGTILLKQKHRDLEDISIDLGVITTNATMKDVAKVYLQETDEEIPIKRLGMDNPILWNDSIVLFEDELDDSGLSQSHFRFRAMKDCFYGLLRFYLRVDEVLIRIYDTRIFHDYNTNYILREFQAKENSYEELRKKGFKFTPEFNMHPAQSDLVYTSLDTKVLFRDKVIFE